MKRTGQPAEIDGYMLNQFAECFDLPVKVHIISDSGKQVEQPEQQTNGSENSSRHRIGKKEQLCHGNDDKHDTHGDVHAGCMQTTPFGICFSSVPYTEEHRNNKCNHDQNEQSDTYGFHE
jgi:hypothetical protein